MIDLMKRFIFNVFGVGNSIFFIRLQIFHFVKAEDDVVINIPHLEDSE